MTQKDLAGLVRLTCEVEDKNMTKWQIVNFLVLRSIGNFMLLFSIFGVLATFGPTLWYEASFRIGQIRGVQYTVASSPTPGVNSGESQTPGVFPSGTPTSFGEILQKEKDSGQARMTAGGFGALLNGPKEQVLIPKDPYFSILIPKVGANEKVFPNVDPNDEAGFLSILYKGVAHAKGTVFPGQPGNIYLFAHSSDNFWDVGRYNAVFYLLKDLNVGDEIVLFFENRRYNYVVTGSKIVDANDVSFLTAEHMGSRENLILQTCWPPGTTWKRLLVFAKRK